VITSRDIPAWINTPFNLIRSRFPEAVVSGGALRDLMHRVPVKDVDVFIELQDRDVLATLRELFPNRPMFDTFTAAGDIPFVVSPVSTIVPEAICDYRAWAAVKGLHGVYSIDNENHPPIQVIVLASVPGPGELASRNDFGLCQIAYDGTNIFVTGAFLADVRNARFTYTGLPDAESIKRSVKRATRLREKFPLHAFIFPEMVV
jgi:hypothetical protein